LFSASISEDTTIWHLLSVTNTSVAAHSDTPRSQVLYAQHSCQVKFLLAKILSANHTKKCVQSEQCIMHMVQSKIRCRQLSYFSLVMFSAYSVNMILDSCMHCLHFLAWPFSADSVNWFNQLCTSINALETSTLPAVLFLCCPSNLTLHVSFSKSFKTKIGSIHVITVVKAWKWSYGGSYKHVCTSSAA